MVLPTLAAAPAAATPLIGAPAVGTCWNIAWADLSYYLDDSAQVDCAQPHTFEVAAVLPVPAKLSGTQRPAAINLYSSPACRPLVNNYVGMAATEAALVSPSSFAGYAQGQDSFFIAPPGVWDSGQGWIACAAGSIAPDRSDLAPLTGSIAGKGAAGGLQLTYEVDGAVVNYRLIAVDLGGSVKKKYPGASKLRKQMNRHCGRQLGNSQYYYSWPSKAQWKLGWHTGYCWVF